MSKPLPIANDAQAEAKTTAEAVKHPLSSVQRLNALKIQMKLIEVQGQGKTLERYALKVQDNNGSPAAKQLADVIANLNAAIAATQEFTESFISA